MYFKTSKFDIGFFSWWHDHASFPVWFRARKYKAGFIYIKHDYYQLVICNFEFALLIRVKE